MDCRTYRENHPGEGEESREHLRSCADCRTFRRTWELLREYPPVEPGPGFLRGIRARLAPAVLRFAVPLAAAAAALLVAGVLHLRPSPGPAGMSGLPPDEQKELAENLDLLQNLELLRALEFVGDFPPPLGDNPG